MHSHRYPYGRIAIDLTMHYTHSKTTGTTALIALLAIMGITVAVQSNESSLAETIPARTVVTAPRVQIARPDQVLLQDQTLFTLVDKNNDIQEFVPDDLVPIRGAEHFFLREEAEEALFAMRSAAQEDGVTLRVISAYRSYDMQATLFYQYSQAYGFEEANTFSALPGESEHQLGTTLDFGIQPGIDFTHSFGDTIQGKWLQAHGHEYGYVMSYPEGREDETGYIHEPWHWRYIGVDLAERFLRSNLTLNQFLLVY